MLSRYLPLSELQSAVSEDQIREFAALLRRLDAKVGYDPITDREFLARIYEAYYGVDFLTRSASRRRLLDYVPADKLQELGTRLELNTKKPFKELADRIARLPWGANETTRTFLEFFGYPPDYMPDESTMPPSEESIAPLLPPLKVLQDYQSSLYFRCRDLLTPPNARFLIQMPTGSGKTRTAMELIASYFNEAPNRTVLWLAHTEELCAQATISFKEVWRHVGKTPVTLHRCWGPYTPTFPVAPSSLIVAGFSKLHSLRQTGCTSPGANLIVVDEAHKVLAPTYAAAIDWAKTLSTRVIGLSATPGRGTTAGEENTALADFFNNQIAGIDTDGQGVIEFLQGRGILARAEREVLMTNVTFHLDREEWQKLEDELEYSRSFLQRIAENHERNRIIIEKLWEVSQEDPQVLVFATSVEQSRLLCAMMLYRGISAAHVDGNTSPETRRAVIAKFRRGEIKFLFNYEVLTTGFDAPGIDVVFIARPTKSLVLYSQMVGRGMRGPAVGGTPYFRLIDVVDNIIDYSGNLDDVYEYFADYWSV
jgi:superfamily II DNA or RNA helicase